jgi:PKD repeat protein
MKFKYLYIIILIISLISIVDAAIPNASFTSNVTVGTVYPLVVQFNDTSIGSPTTWNWSFGDGRWFNTTNPLLVNTTYQYAVAGKYTVNLTVNNTDGTNITVRTDYINLTSDNDDNLTSWLHMNGTNGSTIFSDEKGVAWLSSGSAYISTNEFKYGGASGKFTNSLTSLVTAATSPGFNFSTNDFTIEFWVNVTSSPFANIPIITKSPTTFNGGWGFVNTLTTNNGYVFYMGTYGVNRTSPAITIPYNEWHHIVIERRSGTIYVYKDGILNATRSGMIGSFDTANSVRIGYGGAGPSAYNGFVDELRITNNGSRWKDNFSVPFNEYRGILETIYPDINPNSTIRYKTNATDPAPISNQTNSGIRNRTIQIQNITNTSYVVGEITFNPLYVYAKSVQLNLSYYPTGMTLISSNIDNNNGLIQFNISKPTGFSPGLDRASILDYTALYYNYTDGSDNVTQFFGYGYLINGTTNKTYPIHIFEPVTQIVYEPWNFTANFVANNLTIMNGTPTYFISSFTGAYPNRWNWSFGDGTVDNGINSSVSHTYNFAGLKTINLTEYLWQNLSISNTTIKTSYIEVQDAPPIVTFTSNTTEGNAPLAVQFNDTSSGIVTDWNWSYKNVTGNDTQIWFSTLQNPIFTFGIGNWSVALNASNPNGGINTSNGNYYINVSAVIPPTADFTSTSSGGPLAPITVQFNDTSINFPTLWNWSFGDGNVSALENPSHIYEFCGNFDVLLRVENSAGFSWNNKSNYIIIPCTIPTSTPSTQSKIADKVMDTQNFIYIGVILIIVAGIIMFAGKLLTKKQ